MLQLLKIWFTLFISFVVVGVCNASELVVSGIGKVTVW